MGKNSNLINISLLCVLKDTEGQHILPEKKFQKKHFIYID